MKVISQASETVLLLLERFKKPACCNRMMKYCVQAQIDDGILLFNLLTRELVLLSTEEYSRFTELDYLKERWFVVPVGTDEKAYFDFVKWVLISKKKKSDKITGYTIFPTTDCNARCFYCFELGRSRMPMSNETALKVVQYIKKHCGGKEVKISWFGGEPLFNQEAIDTICDGLHREGIEYTSSMVSNGYLFDEETVKKAVEQWNLKRVQITLDGTEEVYNRVKAYIYREGNPYQIVLNNMDMLLNAGIKIAVRMNMDEHNADNLLMLADELAHRFEGKENFHAYAYHLFKGNEPMAERHSVEEWELREKAMERLEQKLSEHGLMAKRGISKKIRLSHCKADSGRAVTILPDGHIGLCEHYSESEFAGHIDQEGLDPDVVASWKETIPRIPECDECFYYPECTKLKKCANQGVCFLQYRQGQQRNIQQRMICEYQEWQKAQA